MAILKNLVVNGSSRFLNKAYFQDVQIGGTATLSSLSLSGNLSVTGNTTLGGTLGVTGNATFGNITATGTVVLSRTQDVSGTANYSPALIVGGTAASPHLELDANEVQAKSSGTSTGSLYLNNDGGAVYLSGGSVYASGSTFVATTGNIATLNSTNVNVTNNLRANHYDLQTVAQLGGSFYVSPTVKFPNSGTTLAVAKSGTTLTLTIKDSSITSATMAGVVWTAGSGVKVSGTINGVVTGTMDGTVSSINTSSHVLTLSVSGENSANVVAGTYTASQFKDLSVMLYTRKQDGTSKMINTASGAIASFTDGGNNVPLKQLVVDIEPVQDLHGYDSPWPAGGGKNLLPLEVSAIKAANTRGSWSGNVYTDSTGFKFTITLDADGNVNGIVVSGTGNNVGILYIRAYDVPNGSYTVNGVPSGASWGSSNTFRIRIGDKTDAYINDCLSNGVTVSTTNGFNLQINVASGYTANNLTFKPMIRLSSVTDATFAPYSNICPISGHTQAVVTRTGKNLFNGVYGYHNTDRTISVIAGTTLTLSSKSTGAKQINGQYYYSDNTWGGDFLIVASGSTYGSITKTIPSNAVKMAVYVADDPNNNNHIASDTQVEIGSTATAYESPNVATYTIDLDGTRYGGTLDATTGVLTVTHAFYTINGQYTINKHSATTLDGYYIELSRNGLPRCASTQDGTVGQFNMFKIGKLSDGNGCAFVGADTIQFRKDGGGTGAEMKAWFVNNPLQVVYPLATPQTVQLSHTEVRTLSGYNNIWSNTGDTNVIYESSQVDSTSNYNVGIWMNCYDQANSSSTIRVYNGSSRWPNVFLGNMTNADLPRVNGNEPYGYGLYSDNVFLRGIISATGGLIGNWTIGTTGMFYNSDAPGSTSITMIPGGTTASTTSIGGSSGSKSWIFTGKNLFGIDTTGKLYASSAEISGKITAQSGTIGGFHITSSSNQGASSAGGHIYPNSLYRHSGDGTTYEYEFGIKGDAGENPSSDTSGNLAFYVKRINKGAAWNGTNTNMFYVTHKGVMYCREAEIVGKVTANTGYIGGTSGWTIASQQLSNGTLGADNSLYLGTKNLGSNTSIAGRQGSDWRLTVGSHFGVTNTGEMYCNSATIGPWTVTTTSIYKAANTLGSTTSGAAYFGDLGLSVGNKFKVDASGDGAIILGELAEGKTHIEVDSDSFDVCSGATTGDNAIKLATFGEITRIGNGGSNNVLIDAGGFSFTNTDGDEMMKISTDNVVIGKDGSSYFYVDSNSIILKDKNDSDVFKVESGGGNTITNSDYARYTHKFTNTQVQNGVSIRVNHSNIKSAPTNITVAFWKRYAYTVIVNGETKTLYEDRIFSRVGLASRYYTSTYVENEYGKIDINSNGVTTINSWIDNRYNSGETIKFDIMFNYTWQSNTYSNLNMNGNMVVTDSIASDEMVATTSVTSGDFVFGANGMSINEMQQASAAPTITSSNKIDSTPAIGAQLTLYSGVYLLVANGNFNSGSSSGQRINQIAIYTGLNPTNANIITSSRVRVVNAGSYWSSLSTQIIVTVPSNTGQTFTVGLTSSIAQSAASSTLLQAVFLRPPSS